MSITAEQMESAERNTDRTCPDCGELGEISNAITNGAYGYLAGEFHCVCDCGSSFMAPVAK